MEKDAESTAAAVSKDVPKPIEQPLLEPLVPVPAAAMSGPTTTGTVTNGASEPIKPASHKTPDAVNPSTSPPAKIPEAPQIETPKVQVQKVSEPPMSQQTTEPPKPEPQKASEPPKPEPQKTPEPPKTEPQKAPEPPKHEPKKIPQPPKPEPQKAPEPPKPEPQKIPEPHKPKPQKAPETLKPEPEKTTQPPKSEPQEVPKPPKPEPQKTSEPTKPESQKASEPPKPQPQKAPEPPKPEPHKAPEPPKPETPKTSGPPEQDSQKATEPPKPELAKALEPPKSDLPKADPQKPAPQEIPGPQKPGTPKVDPQKAPEPLKPAPPKAEATKAPEPSKPEPPQAKPPKPEPSHQKVCEPPKPVKPVAPEVEPQKTPEPPKSAGPKVEAAKSPEPTKPAEPKVEPQKAPEPVRPLPQMASEPLKPTLQDDEPAKPSREAQPSVQTLGSSTERDKGSIFSLFGINWAPLTEIPMERKLQMLSILYYVNCFLFYPFAFSIAAIVLLFTSYWWIVVGYMLWFYCDVYIWKTSSRGGRRSEWMRRGIHMKYFRDYFPLKLVKTAELSPDKNYIIGTHPHGVMSCSLFGNFGSEATGWSEKFPGIKSHMLTLGVNFMWPILRGYVLWMGCCDVSKESINYLMTKEGTGNAAVIVIGGAQESLNARPGVYKLTLKNRKGFIKMALRTGASLVPCFSFGENDLYEQAANPDGSFVRLFQENMKRIVGFTLPLFYGRGVFNYSFGLVPYRKPVHTVVGHPIDVEKMNNPSQADIDHYHARYIKELSQLFDEYKVKYDIPKDVNLEFI